MSRNMWRLLASAALSSTFLLAMGCAQSVGDVDRTQPDKIDKGVFQSQKEWYYRQTVVDTDVQGTGIFEGYQSSLKRMRWVITQNMLYGCSTTPTVEGPLVEETLPGEECYGIVAAFPVRSHFDVQRSYNTGTGEQSNLIVENSSDRPWYERQYMRVDWSTNNVSGFGMAGFVGKMAAIAWNVPINDGYVEPDRARISEEYIETTTMYTFEPDLNACFNSFGDIYNCEGGEVRVRNSFVPVPKEKTFEPFLHLDRQFVTKDGTANGERLMVANIVESGLPAQVECNEEAKERFLEDSGDFAQERCNPLTFDYFTQFGYFRTENGRLDEWRAVPEDNRLYYANHWNIWQTAYDENGETLDMNVRQVKPIIYYLNATYPRDMVDPALEVGRQWNNTFLKSAALAKGVSVADIEADLEALDGDKRMFRIVRNSCMPGELLKWNEAQGAAASNDRAVRGLSSPNAIIDDFAARGVGDDRLDQLWSLPIKARQQLCAELEYATELRDSKDARFTFQRAGDVRHSFFYWVEEFTNAWSGYGPSSADPQTGEIISGTAHIAGTSLRFTAAYMADLVKYMNGEYTSDEIQWGDQVRRYLVAQKNRSAQTMAQSLTPRGKREVTRRALAGTKIKVEDVSKEGFRTDPELVDLPKRILHKGMRKVSQEAMMMSKAAEEAKRQDTRFADFMSRPEVKSLMMADPQTAQTVEAFALARTFGRRQVTDEDRSNAYLELQAPELVMYREDRSSKFFAEQNIFTQHALERAAENLVTYSGVAEAFVGRTHEEISRYFLVQMMIGTQLHEVGHTVGLRHNFSASMDSLNYQDEFWKVRKAVFEGRIAEPDTSKITDPALVAELTNKPGATYVNEAEFRLGSVMDYTGDITGRFGGLGKYDQAAINFVYAKKVQRWKPEVAQSLPAGFANRMSLANYNEIPLLLSGMSPEVKNSERQLAGIENILNGREWVSIATAKEELRQGVLANTSNWMSGTISDENPPVQNPTVSYNFCTDDRRDFQLGCDVFDWGSSQREIVNHAFNTYRAFQDFWRYSRHNTNRYRQNVNGYYGRISRIFSMVARPFRFYSIYRMWNLGSYTDDLREAAIDAANFYSEALAMPEPARYCLNGQGAENTTIDSNWYYDISNTYMPAGFDGDRGLCDKYIDLHPGTAQYFNYEFTDEYEWRIRYIGTFVDKQVAVQSLFNVSANFLRNQFITDSRATFVSYWTLFRDDMLDLVRGLVLNDYRKFGGLYDIETNTYVAPDMVERETFFHGVPKKQEGKPRIFSLVSFNHEFNALAYAMITNSSWSDRHTDFSHSLKIAVDQNELQDYGDAEVAEFVNPVTQQRYVAPQTADGDSIAFDMVKWANRLKDGWSDSLDIAKTKKEHFDRLREKFSSAFNPDLCTKADMAEANNNLNSELHEICGAMLEFDLARDRAAQRSEQLNDVIAKLDQVRYLWGALGPSVLR